LISFLHGKKNFSMNDLERTGLTVPSSQGGYDRFRNRVMFPLNNHRGQTVGFAGRILPGSNTEQAKYINTPETELYHKGDLLYGLDINKAEIKKKGRAIIVEGEIDLISSWMAGVENAVAIKGSALTGRQLELVYRLCDRLILSMDADLAGGSAARRGIELAEKAGCFVEVIDWSLAGEGTKDVADVVNENPAKWREMTEKTVSIYSFYIDSAIKKFGLTTEGKARVARDVLQFLDLISDEIRKDEYLKELAKKIEVETGILRVQMAKIRSPDTGLSGKETETKLIKSRRELVEEYVVGLAIRNKAVDRLTGKPVKDLIKGDFWKKITEFFSRSRKHSESIKEIVKELPAEMRAKVEELYLEEDDFKETPFDREWDKAIGELEELNVREKITALRATGKQENQPRELLELTGRLNDLTKGR